MIYGQVASASARGEAGQSGWHPCHLHTEPGVDFALAGEVDLSCADVFATTLERIVPLSSGPELGVEAGEGLTFIDHRRLLVLADRLIEMIEMAGMRVESLA
jgi:hypothetical protein